MKQTNKQRATKAKKEPTVSTPDKVFEVDYLVGKALYYFFFIFLLTFITTYI